jgi:Na+-transporting methylmalonyl-CoA/oxaloacetate decarboxylase gamma subunit
VENREISEDMAVDWGQALQIGGIGFGLVFVILIILALTVWLAGLRLGKIGTDKGEVSDKKRGD